MAINKILPELSPDVREQLKDVIASYAAAYRFEGLYERLNGRTVAEVLSAFKEPTPPGVVASGEQDGIQYILYEARPAQRPPAPPDSEVDQTNG